MSKGFYAGSFDPLTNGHLNIIERASQLVDELVVAIMTHPTKKRFIPSEEMVTLIQQLVPSNVTVICAEQRLTVEVAKEQQATVLIRSLRHQEDMTYEQNLAQTNYELGGWETIFLYARPQYQHISSSLVRELYQYKADYQLYVPKIIEQVMEEKRGKYEKE